jgi:hypothetical protein
MNMPLSPERVRELLGTVKPKPLGLMPKKHKFISNKLKRKLAGLPPRKLEGRVCKFKDVPHKNSRTHQFRSGRSQLQELNGWEECEVQNIPVVKEMVDVEEIS